MMKVCVYMYRFIQKNNGFTLLSALVSLSVLMIISTLALQMIHSVQQIESHSYKKDFEWRQFHYFISIELKDAISVTLDQDAIHFNRNDGSIVTYELKIETIHRRVNGAGNEVILPEVEQFIVQPISEHLFYVYGKRKDGLSYEKYYSFSIDPS